MSAALPPGSMVGTGLHQSLPRKSCLEQSVMLPNSRNLTPKWCELCDYKYAQKGGDQGGWSDGAAPLFSVLLEHSPGYQLFPYPNFPLDPNPFPLVSSHQFTLAQAILSLALMLQSELQATSPLRPAKKHLYTFSADLNPFLFEHSYNHTTRIIQGSKFLEFGSITDCSRHDFLGRGGWSFGVNLFLYPPCCLGAVLLTSEWGLLIVESLTFIQEANW